MENICIPQYDAREATHRQLVCLSQRAHALAPRAYAGDEKARAELKQVEEEIDRAAARLWGLTDEELAEIKRSLEELRG